MTKLWVNFFSQKLLRLLIPSIIVVFAFAALFAIYSPIQLGSINFYKRTNLFTVEELGEKELELSKTVTIDIYRKAMCMNDLEQSRKCTTFGLDPPISAHLFYTYNRDTGMNRVARQWNRRIPRVFHTIKGSNFIELSQFTAFEVELRVSHPNWAFVSWSHDDLNELVDKSYHNLHNAWSQLSREAKDQWGFLLGLYEYGGVWMSRSLQLKKNIDKIVYAAELSVKQFTENITSSTVEEFQPIFMAPKSLQYDFMIATPKHPFVLSLINELCKSEVLLKILSKRPYHGLDAAEALFAKNRESITIREQEFFVNTYIDDGKVFVKNNPHIIFIPTEAFASTWDFLPSEESSEMCFADSPLFDPDYCISHSSKPDGNELAIYWSNSFDLITA